MAIPLNGWQWDYFMLVGGDGQGGVKMQYNYRINQTNYIGLFD